MIEISSANNNRYFIQCTTWRDKKQMMFLHTKLVGPSVAHQVKRHVKGKQQRVDLSAPSIQKEYAANFNALTAMIVIVHIIHAPSKLIDGIFASNFGFSTESCSPATSLFVKWHRMKPVHIKMSGKSIWINMKGERISK